jgi:4'-phosphopantetheinyl transferase
VELCTVPLDASAATVAALAEFLSPAERARALRFRFSHLTRRFVVGRAALRALLAAKLGTHPAEVVFEEGHAGKLHLRGRGLEFNVSHSDELAIYGIGRGAAIGVDVERIRAIPDLDAVAQRTFAPAEWSVLASLPAEERTRGFFNCWTRKEAYVKATGDGLLAPLHDFEVTLRPGEPAALRHVGGDAAEAARWSLLHLELEPDFVAAVAVRKSNAAVPPLRRLRSPEELVAAFP